MSLLQNDKAIFHHPLDTSTESLKMEAWDGTPDFQAARVSLGLKSSADAVDSFGAESEFNNTSNTEWLGSTALSPTQFVVAYREGAAFHGVAKVGTITGTTIAFGTGSAFNVGYTDWIAVTTLSLTQVVVAYRISAGLNGTAKVGTVTGTTIAFGTGSVFNSGDTAWIAVTTLSLTQVVVAYRDNTDAGKGKAKVGTIAGTTIAFGVESGFMTGGLSARFVIALSLTQVVVVYKNDGGEGKAKIGTVTGTTIAFGVESEFNTASTNQISATVLSLTQVVVVYKDGADGGKGKAKIGTVTGTTIVFGMKSEFASNTNRTAVTTISSTQFVVTYRNNNGNGEAKVGTVTGTTIAFSTGSVFISSTGDINAVTLTPTQVVVVYRDDSDALKGTAKVGDIPFSASLIGAGASYATTVGATKVAFTGWLRSPSA